MSMADLDLRPERRQAVVDRIVTTLAHSQRGSRVELRGSLAAGVADGYSDIDLCWVVSDAKFRAASASIADTLSLVGRITSPRLDPAFANSDRRRVIFVRLAGMPLFWRVDLEMRAASVADDECYDADNPAARGTEGWSPATSAIENAIAAIKAMARRRPTVAEGLLDRGCARIGCPFDPDASPALSIRSLARACVNRDPVLNTMADEVDELTEALLTS